MPRGAPLRPSPLPATGARTRTKPMKRTQPKRDFSNARAKVDREGRCRYCERAVGQGGVLKLEAAHTIGREHDRPTARVGFDLWVDPRDTIPLCIRQDGGCHGAYDRRELDILPVLTRTEECRAVELVGIVRALARLTGRRAL